MPSWDEEPEQAWISGPVQARAGAAAVQGQRTTPFVPALLGDS